MTAVTLHFWTHDALALGDALKAVATLLPSDAVGLVYTPAMALLASFAESGLRDDAGKVIDLSSVYEACVFGEMGELRWLKTPTSDDGVGRAVFLSEAPNGPTDWNTNEIPHLQVCEPDRNYLLWGNCVDSGRVGWSRLSSARTGAFGVPVTGLVNDQRVALVTREYIGLANGPAGKEHGNAAIVEERLLGLRPVDVCRGRR